MSQLRFKNRRAKFNYEIVDTYTAGMQLWGSEIKSIRNGKVSVQEAHCQFRSDELFVTNMTIEQYAQASINNHEITRARKLLLNRNELNKLQKGIQEKGLAIIPLELFVNGDGLAKLVIALGRGKKLYDKREDLKRKDDKRRVERNIRA